MRRIHAIFVLVLVVATPSMVKAEGFDHASRPGTACSACHAAPRHGAFGACSRCHTTQAWLQTSFSHDQTAFPLDGRHRDNINAMCENCHGSEPRAASSQPRPCSACHADPHGARFKEKRTLLGCVSCHSTKDWSAPALDPAQHRRKASCTTCHTPPKHGAAYGASCGACHDVKAWSATRAFDHQATMFPLDRRHKAVACASCHKPTTRRLSPQCGSCHDDPHRGRAQAECDDCHRGDRWTLIRFDHDRSLFPLRGRHFATPCRDCHTNDEFTGVALDCIGCHRGAALRANQQNKDHRLYSIDCGDCHRPFRW